MCPRFLAYFKCFKTYLSDSAVLGSRQATDTVGDPQEGFRSRFQVDKAFKAPLRFLGFFSRSVESLNKQAFAFVLCKGSTEVWRLRVKSLCLFLSCPRKRAMRFFVRNSKNGTCERLPLERGAISH